MALKKLGKKTDSAKKEGKWRKVITIVEGEHGPYCKANNYKGRLIWEDFLNEEGTESKFYVVKSMNLKERREGEPDFVQYNISVNLDNDKAASELE